MTDVRKLLSEYADPRWEADDFGGSRVLNAADRVGIHDDVSFYERLAAACIEDAKLRGTHWYAEMCSRNEYAASFAIALETADAENPGLGWDATLVIGAWEEQVAGVPDNGSQDPIPIHEDVLLFLKNLGREDHADDQPTR